MRFTKIKPASRESREIVCYNCLTKGKAYFMSGLEINPNTTRVKIVKRWHSDGWKFLQSGKNLYNGEWLCLKCDKERRCKKCGILLSNLRKCNCGKMHGAYYKRHPNYCKKCWNKINKKL